MSAVLVVSGYGIASFLIGVFVGSMLAERRSTAQQ